MQFRRLRDHRRVEPNSEPSTRVPGRFPPGACQLIVAAEELFGEHGIERVSLRQIVAAAGQANSYAVQHHFGTKERLIEAIIEMRVETLEGIRQRKLERALRSKKDLGVTDLLRILWLPLLDLVNKEGIPTYAKLGRQLWYARRPELGIVDAPETRTPVRRRLFHLIHDRLPHLSVRMFDERMVVVQILFLFETTGDLGGDSKALRQRKRKAADAIEMAAGALAAPVSS